MFYLCLELFLIVLIAQGVLNFIIVLHKPQYGDNNKVTKTYFT